mgnify:CR=1 FL=1
MPLAFFMARIVEFLKAIQMKEKIERFFRLKELVEHLKISRSSIYESIKNGTFPKPIRLGKRSVAWSQHQIEDWLAKRRGQIGRAHV